MDPELSGNRFQVYHEDADVVINHKGTQSLSHAVTDLRIMVGDKSVKNNKRFTYSKDITKKAKEKYIDSHITHTSHS